MRRTLLPALLVATTAIAACSGFRDMFSAHANVAAEAAGLELTPKRLSEIVFAATKGQRLTQQTTEFLTNAWVDYALFAVAASEGKLPTDSASVADAMWPDLAELRGTHWHDTLMARRVGPEDKAADSLYGSPDVRLFQHILFMAKAGSAADVKAASRKKAEGALARLRKGADFNQLAAQLSEDPGSRADSGFLPPGPRGRFVPAFDSAAWALKPGETTGLVETPFGFHIIKRPALSAVRPRIKDYLAQQAGQRLDSIYMDSLASSADIKVASNAPAIIRTALDASTSAQNNTTAVTTYKGGTLTVRELMRWVRALPPPYAAQLKAADDSTLKRFSRILTQNVLLLQQADAAGITVTPQEWSDLRQRYFAQLDTLKKAMGLDSASLGDASTPAGDRVRAAGLKMDEFFDQLIQGKSRLRPLPSALATLLRERMPYRIYDAGVSRGLELAQAMKPADSTKNEGLMRRAPGGPPIPGAVPQAPNTVQPAPAPKADSAARPKADSGARPK
jgi:hypothetical protein